MQSAKLAWYDVEERGNLFFHQVLASAYRYFGRSFCYFLNYMSCIYFYLSAPLVRKGSRRFLKQVKDLRGKLREICVYKHIVEFGVVYVDKIAAWSGGITRDDLIWENIDEYFDLLESGRGAVFLSAHFGNIEIGRALSDLGEGVVINALMHSAPAELTRKIMRQVNPDADARIIEIDEVTPDLILNLRERVARGEHVAMLADRHTPGAPDKARSVDFLGAKRDFPEGPFLLTSYLECPVYLIFFTREKDGRYRIHFEKFSDKLDLPRKSRNEQLQTIITRYASRVEHYCRKYPYQWFNFYG